MSLDTIAQLASAVACLVILIRTEPAINRMHIGRTPLLLAQAFWGLAVAAATGLVDILLGGVPPWSATFGALAVAALLSCERRVRYLSRLPPETGDTMSGSRSYQHPLSKAGMRHDRHSDSQSGTS